MATKYYINGMGLYGRMLLRTLVQRNQDIEIWVNDLNLTANQLVDLLNYDTVNFGLASDSSGSFWRKAEAQKSDGESSFYINISSNSSMIISFDSIDFNSLEDRVGNLGIDYFFDCTKQVEASQLDLIANAAVYSFGFGGNRDNSHGTLTPYSHKLTYSYMPSKATLSWVLDPALSAAAIVLDALNDIRSIEWGDFYILSSASNGEFVQDSAGETSLQGRSVFNAIPLIKNTAMSIGLVVPLLNGKITGNKMLVPIVRGSAINMCLKFSGTPPTITELKTKLEAITSAPCAGDMIVSSDAFGQNIFEVWEFFTIPESSYFTSTADNMVTFTIFVDDGPGYMRRFVDYINGL